MTVGSKSSFQFKKFLHLCRALFPNWNFFDQIAYHFEVQFRFNEKENWQVLTFQQKRSAGSLMLNPEGNFAMAQVNIIEHFASDYQNLENPLKSFAGLSSYKLLRSLVFAKVFENGEIDRPVQFKVIAWKPGAKFDIFTSGWLKTGDV